MRIAKLRLFTRAANSLTRPLRYLGIIAAMTPLIVNEVGPRDGLQFEEKHLSVADKRKYIQHLVAASIKHIEIGSFVNPKKVPAMAKSGQLVDIIRTDADNGLYEGVDFWALTMNLRGAEDAIEAGINKDFGGFAIVIAASDVYSQKNSNSHDLEHAMATKALPVIELGRQHGIRTRAYISTVFEGKEQGDEPDFDRVAGWAKDLLNHGAYEVSLGDTTGIGTIESLKELHAALMSYGIPKDKIVWHFHDPEGKAAHLVEWCYKHGYSRFDSSTGGIGGSSNAGVKAKNISTEDMEQCAKALEAPTGIVRDKLLIAADFVLRKLGMAERSLFYVPGEVVAAEAKPYDGSANVTNDDSKYKFANLKIGVKTDKNGKNIASVSLNKKDKLNAFDDAVIQDITLAFRELGQESGVDAIMLCGEGSAFCSGGDLTWMQRMIGYTKEENIADAKKLFDMYEMIKKCPKPTIARVHGIAYAGALGLIAACDHSVAAGGTEFCISEVKLGLRPSTICAFLLDKLGAHNMRVLATSGDVFYANRASDYGLIGDVVPLENLNSKVEYAASIAASIGKEALRDSFEAPSRDSYQPEPVRHKNPTDGGQINFNKILDLIDGVAALFARGATRDEIRDFTANDIAGARTSDHAQGLLRNFVRDSLARIAARAAPRPHTAPQ